jgi:hypothetical protein
MEINATWRPYTGDPATPRADLPDSVFAFPAERAEPMTDAKHVRSAMARFKQVRHVTDAERDAAFDNIKTAAHFYGVNVTERSWRDIGSETRLLDR